MKGRDAARNARRREAAIAAELTQARAELASERRAHHDEVQALRTELVKLRGEIMHEAAQLAEKEVEKRLAEVAEQRRQRGVSDEIALLLVGRMERLIVNSCRYISMTTGKGPYTALCMVWTWITDEDIAFVSRDKMLALGINPHGWVSHILDRFEVAVTIDRQAARRARRLGKPVEPEAISLDTAEARNDSRIHPAYKKWKRYYGNVEFGATELADNDGTVEVLR